MCTFLQLVLAGSVLLTACPVSGAVVANFAGGVLTVTASDFGNVTVTSESNLVKVNGANPTPGATAGSAVTQIVITGDATANTIDCTAVTTSTFPNLASCQISGGDGTDHIQGTQYGDTIAGNGGIDTLIGAGGNDTIAGGPGIDNIAWFPGDGVDQVEGGADNDSIGVNGTAQTDHLTVRIENSRAIFRDMKTGIDIVSAGTGEFISINGEDGKDTATITGIVGSSSVRTIILFGHSGDDHLDASAVPLNAAPHVQLFGDIGHDTLIGSINADDLFGSGGNDTLIGNGGNDKIHGEEDSDLIIWNNGDGSDLVEGGSATDTLIVNASAANGDIIAVNRFGTRATVARSNLTTFSLDIGNMEMFEVNTFGGNDQVTVTPLPTASNWFFIDTGAQSDTLTVHGSAAPNSITVTNNTVSVDSASVFYEPTTEQLNVNGQDEIDQFTVSASSLTRMHLDGGPRHDTYTFNGQNQAVSVNSVTGTLSQVKREPVTYVNIEARRYTNITSAQMSDLDPFSDSTDGWLAFGSPEAGVTTLSSTLGSAGALMATVESTATARVIGWRNDGPDGLPYSSVGPTKYVRSTFSVYATGQSGTSINRIPNLRMRVGNRFAISTILHVQHHINSDPEQEFFGKDYFPTTNSLAPSVYRVDYDPPEIPFLTENPSEGITRAFEAFSEDITDNGSIALAESSIGTYPALPSPGALPLSEVKVYDSSLGDFDGAYFNLRKGYLGPGPGINVVWVDTGAQPTGTVAPSGVTLDCSTIPGNRIGIAAADFLLGTQEDRVSLPARVRIEPHTIYKVRFHATSTQPASTNAHIRFRARTVKWGWNTMLTVGGAFGAGTQNNTMAQQFLPGVGSLNPEKEGTENGGWYTLLVHSPMSPKIRTDLGLATPLSATMPKLILQPGPGVDLPSRRDLMFGLDLIDTVTGSAAGAQEIGNVTLDRIEVQQFRLPDEP